VEWGRYAAYAQLGTEMVAPIGLGVLADYYFHTLPWLTVGGAVLGLLGGFYHLYKLEQRQDAPRK
jgi:F0F1-type ATP synthase assembly protein I